MRFGCEIAPCPLKLLGKALHVNILEVLVPEPNLHDPSLSFPVGFQNQFCTFMLRVHFSSSCIFKGPVRMLNFL